MRSRAIPATRRHSVRLQPQACCLLATERQLATVRRAAIAVGLSTLIVACGNDVDPGDAAVGDTSDVETVPTAAGLECLVSDEIASTEYEAGMTEPGSGTTSIREGVDAYWVLGEGAMRPDKDALVEEIDESVVRYRNSDGHVRLVLRFQSIEDRWVLSSSDSCFTASDWAPTKPDGSDRAGGGIVGPVIYYDRPDELEVDEAEIVGVLELRAGCLYLVHGASESLVLWEFGTEWESGAVVLPDGVLAKPGDTIRGAGGYYPPDQSDSFTASPIVQAALDDCAAGTQIEVAVLQGDSAEVSTN